MLIPKLAKESYLLLDGRLHEIFPGIVTASMAE